MNLFLVLLLNREVEHHLFLEEEELRMGTEVVVVHPLSWEDCSRGECLH